MNRLRPRHHCLASTFRVHSHSLWNDLMNSGRPLKVEVVVDPSKVPLAARVAPRPVAAAAPAPAAQRGSVGPPHSCPRLHGLIM